MIATLSAEEGTNVHVCRGRWGMSKAAHATPEQTSEFEYRHAAAAGAAPPLSGPYTGYFMLKQPAPRPALKVEESSLSLSFEENSQGFYNVAGSGQNRFGSFTVTGTMQRDGRVEMYRAYLLPAAPARAKKPKKPKAEAAQRSQRQNRGSWKDLAAESAPAPAAKRAKKAGGAAKTAGGAASRSGRVRKVPSKLVESQEGGGPKGAADELRKANQLITFLLKDSSSFWFSAPVDPVALNIPDYPQIVKKPMDLGTVRANVTAGRYEGLDAFAEDVRLTFRNAWTYNTSPENPVHKAARSLADTFETRLDIAKKDIEQKRRQRAAAQAAQSAPPASAKAKKARPAASGGAARAKGAAGGKKGGAASSRRGKGKGPRSGGSGGGGGGMQAVPTKELLAMQNQISQMQNTILELQRQASQHQQQMKGVGSGDLLDDYGLGHHTLEVPVTYEEKRQLGTQISRLPQDKLSRVLNIIQERTQLGAHGADEEIEIDIEALDTSTIRELQSYVRKVTGKGKAGVQQRKRARSFDEDEEFLLGDAFD